MSSKKQTDKSSRWMTVKEVAAHYCVGETVIRDGVGDFGRLRQVRPTERCLLIPRSDVEALDRHLERAAVALGGVMSIEEGRRRSA